MSSDKPSSEFDVEDNASLDEQEEEEGGVYNTLKSLLVNYEYLKLNLSLAGLYFVGTGIQYWFSYYM